MKKLGILLMVAAFFMTMSVGAVYATQAKPLVLKVACFIPAHVPLAKASMWIIQEVEKRSGGRIKVEFYYSNSLIPSKQIIEGVQKGVADIGMILAAYQPGKLPLLTVTTLPGASPGQYYATAKAMQEFVQTPEIQKEITKMNMRYLGPLANSNYSIWTSKKQVRSIPDLKGLKLRALGLQANLLHELGAVPVSMKVPEIYMAIDKGTIDGTSANLTMAVGYKWSEVTKYHYSVALGNAGMFIGINRDSWNKIPPDIQKMFADLHDEACRRGHEIFQGAGEKWLKKAVADGRIIETKASAEDSAKIRETAKDKVWSKWIAKMDKKGLPGQKILDRWLELQQKWHAQSPFSK